MKTKKNSSLSAIEKTVMNVIRTGMADPNQIEAIARMTYLPELHVRVAVQLLKFKKMIP